MIPKIIHKTYFDFSILPSRINESLNELKELNPNWELRKYTDSDIMDYIQTNFGISMLDQVNRINPKYMVAKTDLFRYLLIFKDGGLYLDIKSHATLPLDSVIKSDDVCLLARWKPPISNLVKISREIFSYWVSEFHQWFICMEPGHPFLQHVINQVLKNLRDYDRNKYGVGDLGVIRTTGPIAFSNVISQILNLYPHRIIDVDDIGFKYSVFDGILDHTKMFKDHYTLLVDPVVLN